MVNKRLKKLTALLLSIVMVFSMVTEAFPAAFADEEGGGSTPSTETTNRVDFGDSSTTRRPGLYVDFLGDNKLYQPAVEDTEKKIVNERDDDLGLLPGLIAPGLKDQSKVTNEKKADNPNGTVNQWTGYKDPSIADFGHSNLYDGSNIFWVGVGISRMNLLDILKEQENSGIYGLELGFYYDSRYIEPYTGATANNDAGFLEVIKAANLANYESYKWPDCYSIVDARTDLEPQTDPVTQEVIQRPGMDEIMGKTLPSGETKNPWRMTYVSIERTNVDTNRFAEIYNNNVGAEKDLETQYLLLIPFKLKKYDPLWQERVCLRLARSAGLLSIGSGNGDTPYAAWERVTTRNPGRELKLMTNFQGDLNIFGGGRYLEDPYEAKLLIQKAGGDNNTATLTIDKDPSPTPVFADDNGEVITGLYGGTGMRLDVRVETGYSVTVEVYYTDQEGTHVQYLETWPNDNDGIFTFVMPEHNVTVNVIFQVTSAKEFRLHLSEEERNAAGTLVTGSGIEGNSTVLTATYEETDNTVTPPSTTTTETIVDKDSPRDNSRNLPAEQVHYQAHVTADIQVHHDYEAVVTIYSTATDSNVSPVYDPNNDPTAFPSDGTLMPDYTMILPTGGRITFDGGMPQSDVVVYVTYRPAQKYRATLEVHHENVAVSENNVAQLVTTVYTKSNTPVAAYSGIVYEDDTNSTEPDRYRTVKPIVMPFDEHANVLDRVDISSALGSGSLGGDGRAPMEWYSGEGSLMALLYAATSAADFKNLVTPLDLRWDSATPPGTMPSTTATSSVRQPEEGIRKNSIGERYTDSDIDDFFDRLMELQAKAKTIAPAVGSSVNTNMVNMVTVTPAAGAGTAYSYYDLSWEQIQAYILDYERYQKYLADQAAYVAAKDQYDKDKAAYDQYVTDKAAAGDAYEGPIVREPKEEPTAPAVIAPPDLQTKTEAANRVTTYRTLWHVPSTTSDPVTLSGTCYLEVRAGRKMAVVLEAESTYTVASSIIIKDDPANTVKHPDIVLDDLSGLLVRSSDYQNEFLFDMPAYNCIVEVTYTERKAHELELKIVGDYTPTISGNNASVTGYGPNPGSITAVTITPLTKDGDKEKVLEGSLVTVEVHRDEGYSVSAAVEYIDSNNQSIRVPTNPTSTTNLKEDDLFTFYMPAGATTITIIYTDNRERHTATILTTHEGSDTDPGNMGYWHDTPTKLTIIPALEGDILVADIIVMPGFYIYAIEAYTEEGSFPVTLSGNGWNNSEGGNVTATTTMPDANYIVHVVFRPGPPDPEPKQILTLRVNDPDNTGSSKVDNHAEVSTPVILGPLGLALGSSILSQSDYATAGDLVRVSFATGSDDYFVDSVEIQPAELGVAVTRTSATTAEFIMPAASAAVVVTFRRKSDTVSPEKLYLHLAKTEQGPNAGGTSADNRIPSFTSPVIRKTSVQNYAVGNLPTVVPTGEGNTGAAEPGDLVEVSINVAPGWYIHSLTVSGDQGRIGYDLYKSFDRTNPAGAVPYDPTDPTHYSTTGIVNAVATFVMPNSDAYVTVNYRKVDSGTPDPDTHEHEVELLVVDPDNTAEPYADNWASAVVSGVDPDRTIAAVGMKKDAMRRAVSARAGEEVTITYSNDTGYALEIILVTPSGLKVPVNYLGGNKARFIMPDSSVTAIVRFKAEPAIQYTANLVLHFPNGTAYNLYNSIGEGSFLVPPTNGLDYPDPDNPNKLYSRVATPGERLDFDMFAHDGYYISAVTVGPAVLGVPAEYTGSFGRQSGHVIMPAANIQINVYFAAGWPDDTKDDPTTVPYDLTLEVYDASGSGSTANFVSIAGVALSAPNSNPVGSGAPPMTPSLTVTPRQAYDEDRVVVQLNPATGCYAKSITVTDSRGKNVPWQYVPGGIAFEMTPAHVTVTVVYAKLPDPTAPDDPDNPYKSYEVMLHVGSTDGTAVTHTLGWDGSPMGSAVLTGPTGQQARVDGDKFSVVTPPQGQTLTLVVAKPNTGYHVAAAYAVKRSTGEQIMLPMTQVPNGGTTTFAMPEDNADVYVIFADDTKVPGPDPNDLTATLIVAGPAGSGSAKLHDGVIDDTANPVTVTTRDVAASGADSLYAPQGTELTVDLTVNTGFNIAAIRVTDGYGNRVPYTWTDRTQRHFTLAMPAGGVRVYVELEKVTTRDDPNPDPSSRLTAQVVVNNGGNAGNKATLRYGIKNADGTLPTGTQTGTLLTPVYAGDQIWVDIVVQPGYQIEYVKVVPAKYGIAPTLYDLPIKSQDTSFLMPGEDVVVYVKFSTDNRVRRTVTLVAQGVEDTKTNPADVENKATITSVFSGTRGPAYPQSTPHNATVQAAAATATIPAEWVTVDYGWASGHVVTSITVVDASGNPVPFTQNKNDQTTRKGQITFPMVDSNVTVTVTWGTELPKYDAILHVIDLDSNTEITDHSWGQLTWLNPPGTDTGKHQTAQVTALPAPGGTETLEVPAGEQVRVDADTVNAGVYIKAAFVLWRSAGQMVKFNYTPDNPADPTSAFTGHKTAEFTMQPGQNDVYIYYTKEKPDLTEFSAVLMLDSPDSDKTSTATIERTKPGDTAASASDSVKANDTAKTHGYVTAHDGDTITVTVTPADGYSIESILMTPLGTSSDQGGPVVINRTGNTYTFTMPAHNVAVRIKLKEGSDKEYKATLHYKLAEFQDDGSIEIKDVDITKDWAQLSFDYGGANTTWRTDGEDRMVPEGIDVTIGASITGPDFVLAAYVLEENGDMVPLSKALEGLEEQHAASPDNTLLDDESVFTMPAADVHVYVWFTNKKPAANWRTAVLTVTDEDPNGIDNSGLNSATLASNLSDNKSPVEVWSTGVPGHKFIWVIEGETVTVKTATIAAGYSFVEATITHSKDPVTPPSDFVQTSLVRDYEFKYTVGDYNSAVVVQYKASAITRNPLNVVLIDRDNPGDGVTTNRATVTPGSMDDLEIESVTSAGARQRIPDVLSGTKVVFDIEPYKKGQPDGYTAVAQLRDSTKKLLKTWPVGKFNDTFEMLNEETTLEIIYFRGRKVTLSVVDTRGTMTGLDISFAQMTQDAFGLLPAITADSAGTVGVFDGLPAGTELAASITSLAPGTRLVGALVIYPSGWASWISPTSVAGGADEFHYTLAGSDVEIRLIVGPDTETTYLASVSAVNLPTGTAAPQIHVTPTANATEGPGWTVAVSNSTAQDTVEVTATVPYGYKAVINSTDVMLNGTPPTPTIEINGPGSSSAPAEVGTATFTMPAKNVHVTVTYVKTRFTATIQTAGSGSGIAGLTDGTTSVTALGTISGLLGDGTETLEYTATPDTGSTLARILMTTTAGGTAQLLTYTGVTGAAGTFAGNVKMPADDVTITVFFDDDNNRHHIAYVTTEGTDGQSDNAAQDILNTTQDLGGGVLWAYGDKDHEMKVLFTVAPGYRAVVTAEYADGTSKAVSVTQQGGDNSGAAVGDPAINATATLTMPDADVKVTITYSKKAPEEYELKLRLVGHGTEKDNQAKLYAGGYGTTPYLELNGSMTTTLNDLWSTNSLTNLEAGTPLDLDAGRKSNYVIVKATIGLLNGTKTDLIPGTETELPLSEYGTTATSLHYMPGADAVVTVYYRLPYQATLFVVDAKGDDYNDGMVPEGPADTKADHTRTPTVTMKVDRADLGPAEHNPTTFTHTPIKDLNGKETVTTTVDLTTTMPADNEIASVIATTGAGTIHLLEKAPGSGVYEYPMFTATRAADDVDITVILRDTKAPKMYTATVYKVGHDNKPDNTAAIENPTTTGLPNGTIWTGALENDVPVVKVTTASDYYAIVTAVKTGTNPAEAVPVLQWVVEGTAADPIEAIFKMPAHDVDVTVEYVTEKPKANMTLTLEDHEGEAGNKGDLYNDPNTTPDWVTPSPDTTKLLSANGGEAVDTSTTPATVTNPFSKSTTTGVDDVDVGDYLALAPDHGTGYYIKSITFKAAGFTFDMLGDPTFVPRVPLSGGEVIIEFDYGKQSGRPYDPEHSERYNGVGKWTDAADPTKGGNYKTGDAADGNPNPDLSVDPMEKQQGWILAESADAEKLTVVVTVPTLYDDDNKLSDTDALADAGVAPVADGETPNTPPIYRFYWWDSVNSKFVELVKGTDYTVTSEKSLDYNTLPNENPKGDYPKDSTGVTQAQHYGYRLTLQALKPAEGADPNPLIGYIENGGEIYVTATRPGYVLPKADPDDPDVPWVESEMTQVIIKSDNVLKPYDPDTENNTNYDDHWITSENRGDYLIVTVPMLNNKAGDNPTEVDGKIHRLQLHLQLDGTDRNSTIVNVTELLNIVNVRDYDDDGDNGNGVGNFWNVNTQYVPGWRADPNYIPPYVPYLYDPVYENDIYYTDPTGKEYHGARFIVSIKDGLDPTDPLVVALKTIFDNDGTMGTSKHRMYITSDEVKDDTDPLPTFRKDDYTDFEVPRYYSLVGELQSWAPTHVAELFLYREDTANGGYETDPWLIIRSGLCETMSSTGDFDPATYNGHWSLSFAFKSSKLAASGKVLTYQMVVEKTAHITYTHTAIELAPVTTEPLYDAVSLKFSFANPISLFCGDIAPLLPGPDQRVNDRDRDILAGFNYGLYVWTEDESGAGNDWDNSTFNPGSHAYAADLNGDGIISEQDMAILMSEFNWKSKTKDYGNPAGLDWPPAAAAGIMLLSLEEELPLDEELEPEETAEAEKSENGPEAEKAEPPAEDGETSTPEESGDAETPRETENPEGSENTETPEDPVDPDPSGSPEDPNDPQTPEEPQTPAEPEEPDELEEPSEEPTPEDESPQEDEEPPEGDDPPEPEPPDEGDDL